jgi:hypothetical protein
MNVRFPASPLLLVEFSGACVTAIKVGSLRAHHGPLCQKKNTKNMIAGPTPRHKIV